MRPEPPTRCPVCRARLGPAECPRCGADLSRIVGLLAAAHLARSAAREALAEGDVVRAHRAALQANRLAGSPAGARLEAVLRWLSRVDEGRGRPVR